MIRQRTEQTTSLDQRLAEHAKQIKEKAASLPHGKERDDMMRRARQTETASHMNEWLASPGLQAPK
jgi:hypothetical protein